MSDNTKFYAKQISLTEWLENISHKDSVAMREEDNLKRERLKLLGDLTGLPSDQPAQFSGSIVASRPPEFEQFLKEHGHELCAIRLIPTDPALPKLRMRGETILKAMDWFAQQDIDPQKYNVDFVPHVDKTDWATIFVVNQHGIYGEITAGPHSELTQGLYTEHQPITFSYDFKTWKLEPAHTAAEEHLKEMTALLIVQDRDKQAKIADELHGTFAHDYLCGYFETTASDATGTWFIDYNRILGDMYADFIEPTDTNTGKALVTGRVGSAGTAIGVVHIVDDADLVSTTLNPDEILVCKMTTPDYLPLMQQAAAIVTDIGGMLSHAAIVARELKKPCITGTKDATKKLKNGMKIEVNGDQGIVTIL